jgi:hypothetical protein
VCTLTESLQCEPNCAERNAGTTCIPQTKDRLFKFDAQQRLLTGANRELLAAEANALAKADPALYGEECDPPGCTDSVCPGFDLGDPGILHGGQPFRVRFDEGDTLMVEGRMHTQNTPPGIAFATGGGAVSVAVTLAVDGRPTIPNGSTVANADQSTAIDFTFTAR